jgi:hypothetical protein
VGDSQGGGALKVLINTDFEYLKNRRINIYFINFYRICLLAAILILLCSAWVKAEPHLLWKKTFDGSVVEAGVVFDTQDILSFPIKAVLTSKHINLFDDKGKLQSQYLLGNGRQARLSRNARIFAVSNGDSISILSKNFKPLATVRYEHERARDIERNDFFLSPDGSYLVVILKYLNRLCFYKACGKLIKEHKLKDLRGARAVFSEDSEFTLVQVPNWGKGFSKGFVVLFDRQGNRLWDFKLEGNTCKTAVSKNAEAIAIATEKRLYSLNREGKLIYEKELIPGGIHIALSGSGAYLALTRQSDHTVSLIDNRSGRVLWKKTLKGFDPINSPFISLDTTQNAEFIAVTVGKIWGRNNKESFLYLFNKSGELVWKKDFKESKIAVDLSPSGGCVLIKGNRGICLFKR